MTRKFSGIIMVSIILVTMLFSGAAYARDDGLPSPGLTPDSPFYFFDKLGKNIGMFFTFGPEAKASKALQYAEERLAEARVMASANKTAALESAIADYEKYLAWLQEQLEQVKQQVASGNISERVAWAILKHLNIMEMFKNQVNEQAKNAIAHAANVTMDGQINSLRVLGKNKPERALDICANVTERQLEKIRIRASGNITAADMTLELDYAARIAALEEELAAKAEAIGANVTALQRRLAHSTANRLEVLSGVYDKVPEPARPAIASAIENSFEKYQKVIDRLGDNNVPSAASVNETLEKIPAKLREKIQVSTTNRLQITNTATGNATIAAQVSLETQEQNRERLENNNTSIPVITSANQTREQQQVEKQERNTQNQP